MEPLATKDEVAAYLRIDPRTLDNWASNGQGPDYIKVGGARRYDMADVRNWAAERKVRH